MVLVMHKITKTPHNILENIKKYNRSEKGRATRQKWLENNKKKVRIYNVAYQKNLRELMKEEGMCLTCHNQPARPNHTLCENCKKKLDDLNRKRRRIKK